MNSWVNLSALWRILVIGLLAGAGLPALFAVGLRALSLPSGGTRPTSNGTRSEVVGGNPAGLAAAAVCFAIVVAAIAYGIYLVVEAS